MIIDERVLGTTRMLALIGNPVEHTISPLIHNTLSKTLGKNLIYVPFKVEKKRLDYVIEAFKELGVVGFNVTVPYKRDIMRFIDENSRDAILMGAVNTVKIVNGKLHGYNTDAEGFVRSFKEEAGCGFKDKTVFIIGAGGAARAIAVKVASEGAKKIFITNRTLVLAQELAELINTNISEIVKPFGMSDKQILEAIKDSDIIINTTAVGMFPETENIPLSNIDGITNKHIVYDVIYNPIETKLLAESRNKGAKVINGFGMLVYQGILAYEIWTGVKISTELCSEIKEKIKAYLL
jgi:shikimate dehydrogenase